MHRVGSRADGQGARVDYLLRRIGQEREQVHGECEAGVRRMGHGRSVSIRTYRWYSYIVRVVVTNQGDEDGHDRSSGSHRIRRKPHHRRGAAPGTRGHRYLPIDSSRSSDGPVRSIGDHHGPGAYARGLRAGLNTRGRSAWRYRRRTLPAPTCSVAARSGGSLRHPGGGFVGGAGSLLVTPDGPRLIDTPDFPAMFKIEAESHADVLEALRVSDSGTDWFYVSPAAGFGSYAPGKRTANYRTGGDVLLTDEDGNSEISGADFAIAFVDEIDQPTHRRERFGVAY